MNHYLFDLNRDWILGVNPEARGRIAAVGSWHPLLFVDAHEMGPQDTYLFSPAREPRSPHYPASREHWSTVFAQDQAAAFDHRQLVELTSSIAWENYRARFDHAFGIEAEGFSDDASCPLPA